MSSPVDTLKKMYYSNDLPGGKLFEPLKYYHGFFVKHIEDSSNKASSSAWRVGQIASGFLAYPMLGILAGLGMVVKCFGIPSVYWHNRKCIKDEEQGIKMLVNEIKNSEDFVSERTDERTDPKVNTKMGYQIKVTIEDKKKLEETTLIKSFIDIVYKANSAFLKIRSVHFQVHTSEKETSITEELYVRDDARII